MNKNLLVTKRSGAKEHIDLDKIHRVLDWAAEGLDNVSVSQVELRSHIQFYDGWKKPDKIDNMNHLEIVHLAYDIFEAQDKRDYAFLESIAAEGTTVDRKNNKFKFENVTYPFEMEFFTKEDLGELEFRYTHEEDGVVYVGFGAIDYENESSFVVDFEFVKEGGKWKMRSMDINK